MLTIPGEHQTREALTSPLLTTPIKFLTVYPVLYLTPAFATELGLFRERFGLLEVIDPHSCDWRPPRSKQNESHPLRAHHEIQPSIEFQKAVRLFCILRPVWRAKGRPSSSRYWACRVQEEGLAKSSWNRIFFKSTSLPPTIYDIPYRITHDLVRPIWCRRASFAFPTPARYIHHVLRTFATFWSHCLCRPAFHR